MKKKYIVTIKEIHACDYVVFAESKSEAKAKVADGDGEPVQTQYDTLVGFLDLDKWGVELSAPISSIKFSKGGRA